MNSRNSRKQRRSNRSTRGGAIAADLVSALTPAVLTGLDVRYVTDARATAITTTPPPGIATSQWKKVGEYKTYQYWMLDHARTARDANNPNGGDIFLGNFENDWKKIGPQNESYATVYINAKNLAGTSTLSLIGSLPGGKKYAFKLENADKSSSVMWIADRVVPTVGFAGGLSIVTDGRPEERMKKMFFDQKVVGKGSPPGPGVGGSKIYTLSVAYFNPATDSLPENAGKKLVPMYVVYTAQ